MLPREIEHRVKDKFKRSDLVFCKPIILCRAACSFNQASLGQRGCGLNLTVHLFLKFFLAYTVPHCCRLITSVVCDFKKGKKKKREGN